MYFIFESPQSELAGKRLDNLMDVSLARPVSFIGIFKLSSIIVISPNTF
jgi:hypothetical protein